MDSTSTTALRKRAALGELNKNLNKSGISNDSKVPAQKNPVAVFKPKHPAATTTTTSETAASIVIPERVSSRRTAATSTTSRPLRDITLVKRQPSSQGGRIASKRPKVLDERDSAAVAAATVATEEIVEKKEELALISSTTELKSPVRSSLSVSVNAAAAAATTSAAVANLAGIDYDWQDLDAEEADDPLMVSEYVDDIFDYLWRIQDKYLPIASYPVKVQSASVGDRQPGVTWRSRGILVDWLVEVHLKFRLLPETLFLAVNIVDRYFSKEKTGLSKIQLVGVASLFIASKYEEVYCPSIHSLSFIAEGSTDEEILQMEKDILRTLDFEIGYPNPMNFLRRISKADDYDMETRTIGKYLLEISLMDHRLVGYTPSILSAAAMYFSRMILNRPSWNGNLMHYSGYPEHDLYPVINIMIDYIGSSVIHEAFFKKYASRKFLKASILCRTWVKDMIREQGKIHTVYPGYSPVEDPLSG